MALLPIGPPESWPDEIKQTHKRWDKAYNALFPTDFELKVLRWIAKGARFQGNCMVHYCAAARRLERKGFAEKDVHWHVTQAGREFLAKHPDD